MISKIILTIDDLKYIDDYREVGITTFLFPLKDYSVGYNTYTLDEINSINVSNKYILLNRVLDCKDIDNLKEVLKNLKDIKGIVFEDIGLIELVMMLFMLVVNLEIG